MWLSSPDNRPGGPPSPLLVVTAATSSHAQKAEGSALKGVKLSRTKQNKPSDAGLHFPLVPEKFSDTQPQSSGLLALVHQVKE